MTHRFSLLIVMSVFVVGIGTGWLGKSWLGSTQSLFIDNRTSSSEPPNGLSSSSSEISRINPPAEHEQNSLLQDSGNRAQNNPVKSVEATFTELLNSQQYFEAVNLYQETNLNNSQAAAWMRRSLLDELKRLIEIQDNSAFSSLIDNYLSINYDDIDALFLLADFNQANGSYLEVVDVYLLAKTYAYNEANQERVTTRFNGFVEQIDSFYTAQKNWWSLLNFYSHINTSGLMTSVHQYRQALAHSRYGDENYAISQLSELLNDSLIGDAAAQALADLTGSNAQVPVVINTSVWDGAESFELKKHGNQFSISLANNQQDSVNLLIDTGASMTAMSSAAFNMLNANNDAVLLDQRVFRTAGGVVQGTVYSIPNLVLGPYLLDDTKIAVIDFGSDRRIDGLLGMNILGQFRFQIDQEKSRLLLLRK